MATFCRHLTTDVVFADSVCILLVMLKLCNHYLDDKGAFFLGQTSASEHLMYTGLLHRLLHKTYLIISETLYQLVPGSSKLDNVKRE